jgi:putative ABC transport system permease protein
MRLDLLHLARSLRRSPASAAAAVLTLALTLGAGGSIFAVVRTVVLTPPPFANPDELVLLGDVPVEAPAPARRAVRYATFEAWRERATGLAVLAAFDGTNATLTGLGPAERVSITDVTPDFLPLLGVSPVAGRSFDREDIGHAVAIVSHRFWREKLGADPAAVGRDIVLGNRPHTVVGVLPEPFVFEFNLSDIWRPLPVTAEQAAGSGYRVLAIARLADGVSPVALGTALDDVSGAAVPRVRVAAVPIVTVISGEAGRTVGLLGGAAAIALVIAFVNFAGLLMVRSIDRRTELAVRSALGGRRSEIARQLLLEAHVLVALGTAAGVMLALWMTPAVAQLALRQFGGIAQREVAVGWPVIVGIALAASACAWICALLPALLSARRSVIDTLRRGATPPPRELFVRRLFVCGQVALAFVLLVAVTLLGRSLFAVLTVNPGFDARGVTKLQVSLPTATYDGPERVASFYSSLRGALEARLGRGTTGVIDELPLTGDRGRTVVSLRQAEAGPEGVLRSASPGYFEVMRIPVLAGRSFDAGDHGSAPRRVVLSTSMAEGLFPRANPIGRQVWLAAMDQPAEIVGVVGDVRHRALEEPVVSSVYVSAQQEPSPSSNLVVRSAQPEPGVIAAVREEVARLDPRLPVYGIRSMEFVVAESPGVPARRVLAAAFTGFAILAVVLAAVGLFGVVANDVAMRRTELALRMALGADPWRILTATVGQGALMVGGGGLAGALLSIWAARALGAGGLASGRLDALSVGIPATMLVLAAAVALGPAARRAARTDPRAALRGE